MNDPRGDIILYQSEDGRTRLEVRLEGGTVWLSQALMAELYQTSKQNISLHLQNIYDEGELDRTATVKEYLTVRQEGRRAVRRSIDHYNLDAKNYLSEEELKSLNRIVTMYLDYAEDQAERHRPMHMAEWKDKLDAFLQFTGREVLDHPGKVSHEVAKRIAEERYEAFRAKRVTLEDERGDDDFDAMAKRVEDE